MKRINLQRSETFLETKSIKRNIYFSLLYFCQLLLWAVFCASVVSCVLLASFDIQDL